MNARARTGASNIALRRFVDKTDPPPSSDGNDMFTVSLSSREAGEGYPTVNGW
jgi:hypothetical protein